MLNRKNRLVMIGQLSTVQAMELRRLGSAENIPVYDFKGKKVSRLVVIDLIRCMEWFLGKVGVSVANCRPAGGAEFGTPMQVLTTHVA